MRKRVLERARLGGFGVAADVWFATITRKIDAMKGLEDQLADGIHQQVLSLRQAALECRRVDGRQWLTLALAVAFGLLVNRVLAGIHRTAVTARQLASGDGPPGWRWTRRTNWASCNPRCNTPSSIRPI